MGGICIRAEEVEVGNFSGHGLWWSKLRDSGRENIFKLEAGKFSL